MSHPRLHHTNNCDSGNDGSGNNGVFDYGGYGDGMATPTVAVAALMATPIAAIATAMCAIHSTVASTH